MSARSLRRCARRMQPCDERRNSEPAVQLPDAEKLAMRMHRNARDRMTGARQLDHQANYRPRRGHLGTAFRNRTGRRGIDRLPPDVRAPKPVRVAVRTDPDRPSAVHQVEDQSDGRRARHRLLPGQPEPRRHEARGVSRATRVRAGSFVIGSATDTKVVAATSTSRSSTGGSPSLLGPTLIGSVVFGGATVTSGLRVRNAFSPIPFTFMSSSIS